MTKETCWKCDGSGMAIGDDGDPCICNECKYDGVVPVDPAATREAALQARIEELVKERDYTEGTNDTLIALNQALEDKLALMIFERDEVMMFERDEAWKRAAHSEKMWGEAEVKLAKAVEALRNTLDKPRDADQSYVELWADTIKEVRAVLTELEGETK